MTPSAGHTLRRPWARQQEGGGAPCELKPGRREAGNPKAGPLASEPRGACRTAPCACLLYTSPSPRD
eukprot:5039894-Alexandrium_andersonii.AAC.1